LIWYMNLVHFRNRRLIYQSTFDEMPIPMLFQAMPSLSVDTMHPTWAGHVLAI
jgi:hypothetical protein